ncbi:uncharacterized protein BBA_03099 [Beauveria bassiana ARSEF 2860]|uniref:Uncharacterized protein n=1 Tax=Beauveria bassiana (strain ARSEF 2860) TaxID=655819 RepID=J5JTP7_BEAB2|nr:uncharacterized protein BBA_03099 [Beauveria bassiana ARSEF 2860]EJP68203.1 hypothetical protein BBA_03099 [Beauveria bassiana ARSEF 2860]
MKYLGILAIPSILAAANPLSPRQEEGQVALDADKLLNLRASFCLDYTKPECEAAIQSCQADESRLDEDCILNEYPDCIEDETSACSQAAAQCLSDYGEEIDADQAVESCIIEDVFPESEEEKQPTEDDGDDGDEGMSDEIGDEEEAPSSSVNPEQAAVCKKASAEYEVVILNEDCKEFNDVEEGVDEMSESSACEAARAIFEKTWTENDCDATIRPQE